MSIRIVTDSTCDLPQALIEKHHITVIPLYVNAEGKTYRDVIDLSRDEFYRRLPGFKPAATTAAAGPEVFRQAYEKLAAEGATEILSIHISIQLSAVVDIARQAAKETTVIPVTVVDSQQLSLGTGFEVLRAAQAAEDGRSMAEILTILEDQIERTHTFAALDTLEFLRRSGRMNFAISFLGTLLHIKPFLKMHRGSPTAERIRTRTKAMKHLMELLQEAAPIERAGLVHSQTPDKVENFLSEARHLLPEGEIIKSVLNPALGTHLGPGVIGFSCITKKKEEN